MAVSISVAVIWLIVFFALGISRTASEVENFVLDHRHELGQALAEGDFIHVQSILFGLKKFGVESATLDAHAVSGYQSRNIYSGLLNKSFLLHTNSVAIIDNGLDLGSLNYRISPQKILLNVLNNEWLVIVVIIISNLILLLILNSVLLSELRLIHQAMTISIKNGEPLRDELIASNFLSRALFSHDLSKAIKHMLNDMNQLKRQEAELAILKVEKSVAKQVAHDIRSPLSALNLISKQLAGPDDVINLFRLSTQRINSIANDLLKRGDASQVVQSNCSDTSLTPSTLSLDSIKNRAINIMNETRVRFPNVHFELEHTSLNQLANIETDANVLDRMISILINNAAESLYSDHSFVKITLIANDEGASIIIEDNGQGIPAEILSRIGENGLSHGKINGNGLGLFYVRNSINKMGGEFKIHSIINKGTTAKLILKCKNLDLTETTANLI